MAHREIPHFLGGFGKTHREIHVTHREIDPNWEEEHIDHSSFSF
jgi:hypothetical protein